MVSLPERSSKDTTELSEFDIHHIFNDVCTNLTFFSWFLIAFEFQSPFSGDLGMNAKEMNVIISLCYRTLIKILNNLIDKEQRIYYVQTNTLNI